MIRAALLALALTITAHPAFAALTSAQLATVQAAPAAGAHVPMSVPFTDLQGRSRQIGEATGGRPALLILSDYRCTQLCGSILGIAGRALTGVGLSPEHDFALVVAGFNPDADVADGRALRDAELAAYPEVRANAVLLDGPQASIEALEQSVGFTALRDPGASRFAHPIDLYVLTPDGRVSRVLNGLSLEPYTLRLALVEAGEGRIGSLVDRLHVLCYGIEPLAGAYTGLAQTMLRTGAILTLLCAGGFGVMALRRRRAKLQLIIGASKDPHAEEARRAVSKHGAGCEPLADPSKRLLGRLLRMKAWGANKHRHEDQQLRNGLRQ